MRALPDIGVVVPLFNEEALVDELVRRLSAALSGITAHWVVWLVDDGSRDATWKGIEAASMAEPRVRGLRFSRNFGQHVAISAGLDHADAHYVVVMDGDLQDLPETIPELYAKATEGWDVVLVERKDRPIGWLYGLAQRTFYGVLKFLARTEYNPAFGNFSILARKVVVAYRSLSEGSRFFGGLVFWLGFQRTTITAPHGERFAGPPSYNLRRRLRLASDIIIAYSVRPLHFAVLLGVISTVFSFGYGCTIIYKALFDTGMVEGWASLIVSIYFVGGVIMTLLGLNSIYLGRVYQELKRRPLYVVSELASPKTTDDA
ncbi:MAG: glycosyltransferase family 2 protein [Myxococcota bacterium]